MRQVWSAEQCGFPEKHAIVGAQHFFCMQVSQPGAVNATPLRRRSHAEPAWSIACSVGGSAAPPPRSSVGEEQATSAGRNAMLSIIVRMAVG